MHGQEFHGRALMARRLAALPADGRSNFERKAKHIIFSKIGDIIAGASMQVLGLEKIEPVQLGIKQEKALEQFSADASEAFANFISGSQEIRLPALGFDFFYGSNPEKLSCLLSVSKRAIKVQVAVAGNTKKHFAEIPFSNLAQKLF